MPMYSFSTLDSGVVLLMCTELARVVVLDAVTVVISELMKSFVDADVIPASQVVPALLMTGVAFCPYLLSRYPTMS